jgi:hypothetical protein
MKKAVMMKAWANWSCPHCFHLQHIQRHRVRLRQAVTMPMTQLLIPLAPHPFQRTGHSVRAAHQYDLSTPASILTQPLLLSHLMDLVARNEPAHMGAKHLTKALLVTQLQKTKHRSLNSHQFDPNLSSHLPKAPHLAPVSRRHRGSQTSAMVPQLPNLRALALERSAAGAMQKYQSRSF